MSARRLEQGVPGVLALWVLVLVGIAAGGGFILAHFLNRDLRRLAEQAACTGRGEEPSGPPPDGPRELRALGQALERMARDLRQSGQDRAVLLAGVSHDLRTPLARIRLSLEMLGDADPELREGIVQDVDEMDAIIGQFIACIRDGHDEAPVPGDLNALIREVAARVARVRSPPALNLAPLPPMALRPMAMRRLLINLLENAHRHGGEPVEVETATEPGRLVVRVLDRGPGVPAAEIEVLFEPFTRGRTRGGGSGLGLVVARRIARLHGGELVLANRSGGGLEARVVLPVGD
jgi:two-component system osmolarity sensor histidine kinase EnvZ